MKLQIGNDVFPLHWCNAFHCWGCTAEARRCCTSQVHHVCHGGGAGPRAAGHPCAVGSACNGLQEAAASANIVGAHYYTGPACPHPHAPHAGPCMRTPAPGNPRASLTRQTPTWIFAMSAFLWPCRWHAVQVVVGTMLLWHSMLLRCLQTKCEMQFSTSCIKATHALTAPCLTKGCAAQSSEHVVEGIRVKINRAGPRPEYQGTEERQVRT